MKNFRETDRDSAVFLYEQIKMGIKNMIKKEEIVQGDRLPSEKILCKHFDASRITVRRAIKELEREGVLEVVHGKGTFVSNPKLPIHILNLEGFTEGLSITENQFTKKVVEKEIILADDFLMKKFNRDKPFKLVKLVRIIKDEYDVLSLDYAYLPCDIYPNITPKIEDNVSTFNVIHSVYGIEFKHAKKEIDVTFPTAEISELFEVSIAEPVIKIDKVISSTNDLPVHYSEYYLLASRVSLNIEVEMESD